MPRTRCLIKTVVLAIAVLCGAQTAAAQITSLGTTTSGPIRQYKPGSMLLYGGRGSAVAYDDKHDVFLHVWEDAGTVVGRFIGFDGTPRGIAFTIAPALAFSPVVVYSRGAADDVFCVLVNQGQASTAFGIFPVSLVASFVRFTSTGPTGGAFVGSPGTVVADQADGVKVRAADAVFNPIARRFLLAWAVPAGVGLQHFDGSGAAADSVVTMLTKPSDPDPTMSFAVSAVHVDYDWQQRKYAMNDVEAVSHEGPFFRLDTTATHYARVLDETRLQTGPSVRLSQILVNFPTSSIFFAGTDVTYLPEASGFLVSWSGGDNPGIQGTFVPTTNPAGAGASYPLLSGHNDNFATVEYDALSRRALVADLGDNYPAFPQTSYVGGALLDGSGQPATGWTALATGAGGGLGLRATIDGQFVVSYGTNSGSAVLERFSVPLASPPGPRFSNVTGHLDGPVNGATVGSSFLFSGWALDFGASTGTGIDAVHGWAFPTDGSAPIFLGADQIFHARGDVASFYGPHFNGSGFGIPVNGLGAGAYTLVAYGRSTVSGVFAQLDAVTVTVASQPVMSLDVPSDGATVGPSFTVGGWAIDLSAASGTTGVDAIHVWAFNTNGSPAMFAGAAAYGAARPDVAAAFGASQFTNAGFNLTVTSLPAGTYDLGVYARSTVSGSFNQVRVVRVTVP